MFAFRSPLVHDSPVLCLVLLLAGAVATGCGPDAAARGEAQAPPAADTITVELTVRIGERMSDLCARLEEQGVSSCAALRTVAAAEAFDGHDFVPPPADRLNRFEGVFRPANYRITLPESVQAPEQVVERTRRIVESLIQAAAGRFANPEGAGAAGGLGLRQQMILASIIEKEAVSNRDYDKVSAVFHNRLRRKMALGSCPTVEYALGYHRPFLLFKDLELDSPYNVYKRPGLPPTPIAFFSDGALAAARAPADADLLFFVYDWTTGNLSFAADYSDHKRFAARARKNFKREFGKAMMYRKFPGKFYEM